MATDRELELAAYEPTLIERSGNSCELCGASDSLALFDVPPETPVDPEKCAYICETCRLQITGESDPDEKHWFCLNDSTWSGVPAIQALALRMLNKLSGHDWAQNLADQMYLEDDVREWAESGMGNGSSVTKDSNGVVLQNGDSVTVIKDLDVKGTSFVAKRGTVVKGVRLTPDGDTHVEGKVNGTMIYIKTEFIKKN